VEAVGRRVQHSEKADEESDDESPDIGVRELVTRTSAQLLAN
jgi:hypothetical protein